MRRRRTLIITICLVCIGIVLAVVFAGRTTPEDPPNTAVVTCGDMMIVAPVRGNLEMPGKAYLSFGVTGTVAEILVERGESVEEGQMLARLDAPSLESSVEMAELQVKIAQTQVKTAQKQYERARDNGWEAPEGWEFLEEAIEFLAGLMVPDEETAKASLDMAKLNLDMAKLNMESAKLNLEKAVIVAPFGGIVADITITEGQELSAAALAAPAISLVDTGEIEMRGLIDELDITMVKVGQNVTIVLDAMRDAEVKGRVAFISPIATVRIGVVSYETIITLQDYDEELRDGMSATANIIVERRDNVLLIPNRAIRGTVENPVVVVYVDGQHQEREVVPGLTDGINTEVLSGLEEGEKVVVGTLPASDSRPRGPFGMLG